VQSTIDFLVRYVDIHFRTEEYFMEKYAYPLYEHHKAEHRRLTAVVLSEVDRIVKCEYKRDVITRILTEMGTWIVEHVLKMDKSLGKFLKSLGPKLDGRVPDDLTADLERLLESEAPNSEDQLCRHMKYCSIMFAGLQDKAGAEFWRERFCLDAIRREQCRRKVRLEAGAFDDEDFKTVLPNGDRLPHLGF
jgi:hypothetical protein